MQGLITKVYTLYLLNRIPLFSWSVEQEIDLAPCEVEVEEEELN